MFDFALVILPFSNADPGEAIRTSLSRYQRGRAGEIPAEWLSFHDETPYVIEAHEAVFTFGLPATGGLSIRDGTKPSWLIDGAKVTAEMNRRGLSDWTIRFADEMSLDEFSQAFGRRSSRDPRTGRYGLWLNDLGRWDWWDLGGRFDGRLIGDRQVEASRPASRISSGDNPGRRMLANIEEVFSTALGHDPPGIVDVRVDRNIELASTVLESLREEGGARPAGAVVLPPGVVDDRLRWIGAEPSSDQAQAFHWLGLSPDAPWVDAVEASLERFADHWVAGVAYHL